MMRAQLVPVAFLLGATPTTAQTTRADASTWSLTFYGCDGARSCHRVQWYGINHNDDTFYTNWTVYWQGWFHTPGMLFSAGVTPVNPVDYDLLAGDLIFVDYDEQVSTWRSLPGWTPAAMGLSLLYGPLGTWDDLTPGNATLTPTPEPASLLLLATGVLGIGLHARRKRGDRT